MAHAHDRPSESVAVSSTLRRPSPLLLAESPANYVGPVGADPLSQVLRTVKLTGALFFMVDATSPWGIEVPHADAFAPIILPSAQHVVSYHIVLQGSAFASVLGMQPTLLNAGDIVVFPHADPYAMLSRPGQAPEFSESETLEFFRLMTAGKLPFVVSEGGGGRERARFVCGFLGCYARPFNPLLNALPRMLHIKHRPEVQSDLLDCLVDLTIREAQQVRAGSECIRLGLSELIFVEVLRRFLATCEVGQMSWFTGLRDPIIGQALALLHENASHSWTLRELARNTAVSRSVLAERFTAMVGCPPMQYLTQWRMQLAARLLTDSSMKIRAVSQEVGYASEAAFSRTFKRIAGVPPVKWRMERSSG
jgi:AraC-like DNA-binding protein